MYGAVEAKATEAISGGIIAFFIGLIFFIVGRFKD
jgi:hypothetical protein